MAGAENGPNPPHEQKTQRMPCSATVWPMQNKGFRGERLERRTAETNTGATKRKDGLALRPFGQCGIQVSAANGWSKEWLKPAHEQEHARTALQRDRLANAELRFLRATAGAENGPNQHMSKKTQGRPCIAIVWAVRNKGFRG